MKRCSSIAMNSFAFLLMVLLKIVSFFKVYNIHGLYNGHYVPLVSMLLPGMSENITVAYGMP